VPELFTDEVYARSRPRKIMSHCMCIFHAENIEFLGAQELSQELGSLCMAPKTLTVTNTYLR
jgi:hypothetical protein